MGDMEAPPLQAMPLPSGSPAPQVMGDKKPATPQEEAKVTAHQAARLIADKWINSDQDDPTEFSLIFLSNGESLSVEEIEDALLVLYPNGNERINVRKIWEALRAGMTPEQRHATDLDDDAHLKDMFGGMTVTLRDVKGALVHARAEFSAKSDEYNFYTWKEGEINTSLAPPSALKDQMTDEYRTRVNIVNQPTHIYQFLAEAGLNESEQEEEMKRITANIVWSRLLKFCYLREINLDELDMSNSVVAARMTAMALKRDNNKGKTADYEKEIESLKTLQKSGLLQKIQNKYYLSRARGDDAFYGIDLSKDETWAKFQTEFPSVKAVENMFPGQVFQTLVKLQNGSAVARKGEALPVKSPGK